MGSSNRGPTLFDLSSDDAFIARLERCLADDADKTVREPGARRKKKGDLMPPRWDIGAALGQIIEEQTHLKHAVASFRRDFDQWRNTMATALENLQAASAKISQAVDDSAAENAVAMQEIKDLVGKIVAGSNDPAVQALADQISAKADVVIASTSAMKQTVDAANASVPPTA